MSGQVRPGDLGSTLRRFMTRPAFDSTLGAGAQRPYRQSARGDQVMNTRSGGIGIVGIIVIIIVVLFLLGRL
jgi:hypothetical protein